MINPRAQLVRSALVLAAMIAAPRVTSAASVTFATYTVNAAVGQPLRSLFAVDTFADGSHRTGNIGSLGAAGRTTLTNPFGSSTPVASSILLGLYTGADNRTHVFAADVLPGALSTTLALKPLAESRLVIALTTASSPHVNPTALANALGVLSGFNPAIDATRAATDFLPAESLKAAAAPPVVVPLPAAVGPACLTLLLAGGGYWVGRRRAARS